MKTTLLLIFTIVSASAASQESGSMKLPECQSRWIYRNLPNELNGRVLFHQTAGFHCGTMSTASITIVEIDNRDTIRVLEFCNVKKEFPVGSRVIINPQNGKPSKPDFVGIDPYSCKVKDAFIGLVSARWVSPNIGFPKADLFPQSLTLGQPSASLQTLGATYGPIFNVWWLSWTTTAIHSSCI